MIRLLLILPFLATTAHAQPQPCGNRASVVGSLANEYLEAPLLEALRSDGQRVELFGNPRTGTWTLLAAKPGSGEVCVIGAGEGLQAIPFEGFGDDL